MVVGSWPRPIEAARRRLTRVLSRAAFALGIAAGLGCGVPAVAQTATPLPMTLSRLADGVWLIPGEAGADGRHNGCRTRHVGAVETQAGWVLIGSGQTREHGERIRATLARQNPLPIALLIRLDASAASAGGEAAFADVPRGALRNAWRVSESPRLRDSRLRRCGPEARGSGALAPTRELRTGGVEIGGRRFELLELDGRTASDLVLVDRATGTVFLGGLVTVGQLPVAEEGPLGRWGRALQGLPARLAALSGDAVGGPRVPGVGPLGTADPVPAMAEMLGQLDDQLRDAAERGLEPAELLLRPVAEAWRALTDFEAGFPAWIQRVYPRYEAAALGAR